MATEVDIPQIIHITKKEGEGGNLSSETLKLERNEFEQDETRKVEHTHKEIINTGESEDVQVETNINVDTVNAVVKTAEDQIFIEASSVPQGVFHDSQTQFDHEEKNTKTAEESIENSEEISKTANQIDKGKNLSQSDQIECEEDGNPEESENLGGEKQDQYSISEPKKTEEPEITSAIEWIKENNQLEENKIVDKVVEENVAESSKNDDKMEEVPKKKKLEELKAVGPNAEAQTQSIEELDDVNLSSITTTEQNSEENVNEKETEVTESKDEEKNSGVGNIEIDKNLVEKSSSVPHVYEEETGEEIMHKVDHPESKMQPENYDLVSDTYESRDVNVVPNPIEATEFAENENIQIQAPDLVGEKEEHEAESQNQDPSNGVTTEENVMQIQEKFTDPEIHADVASKDVEMVNPIEELPESTKTGETSHVGELQTLQNEKSGNTYLDTVDNFEGQNPAKETFVEESNPSIVTKEAILTQEDSKVSSDENVEIEKPDVEVVEETVASETKSTNETAEEVTVTTREDRDTIKQVIEESESDKECIPQSVEPKTEQESSQEVQKTVDNESINEKIAIINLPSSASVEKTIQESFEGEKRDILESTKEIVNSDREFTSEDIKDGTGFDATSAAFSNETNEDVFYKSAVPEVYEEQTGEENLQKADEIITKEIAESSENEIVIPEGEKLLITEFIEDQSPSTEACETSADIKNDILDQDHYASDFKSSLAEDVNREEEVDELVVGGHIQETETPKSEITSTVKDEEIDDNKSASANTEISETAQTSLSSPIIAEESLEEEEKPITPSNDEVTNTERVLLEDDISEDLVKNTSVPCVFEKETEEEIVHESEIITTGVTEATTPEELDSVDIKHGQVSEFYESTNVELLRPKISDERDIPTGEILRDYVLEQDPKEPHATSSSKHDVLTTKEVHDDEQHIPAGQTEEGVTESGNREAGVAEFSHTEQVENFDEEKLPNVEVQKDTSEDTLNKTSNESYQTSVETEQASQEQEHSATNIETSIKEDAELYKESVELKAGETIQEVEVSETNCTSTITEENQDSVETQDQPSSDFDQVTEEKTNEGVPLSDDIDNAATIPGDFIMGENKNTEIVAEAKEGADELKEKPDNDMQQETYDMSANIENATAERSSVHTSEQNLEDSSAVLTEEHNHVPAEASNTADESQEKVETFPVSTHAPPSADIIEDVLEESDCADVKDANVLESDENKNVEILTPEISDERAVSTGEVSRDFVLEEDPKEQYATSSSEHAVLTTDVHDDEQPIPARHTEECVTELGNVELLKASEERDVAEFSNTEQVENFDDEKLLNIEVEKENPEDLVNRTLNEACHTSVETEQASKKFENSATNVETHINEDDELQKEAESIEEVEVSESNCTSTVTEEKEQPSSNFKPVIEEKSDEVVPLSDDIEVSATIPREFDLGENNNTEILTEAKKGADLSEEKPDNDMKEETYDPSSIIEDEGKVVTADTLSVYTTEKNLKDSSNDLLEAQSQVTTETSETANEIEAVSVEQEKDSELKENPEVTTYTDTEETKKCEAAETGTPKLTPADEIGDLVENHSVPCVLENEIGEEILYEPEIITTGVPEAVTLEELHRSEIRYAQVSEFDENKNVEIITPEISDERDVSIGETPRDIVLEQEPKESNATSVSDDAALTTEEVLDGEKLVLAQDTEEGIHESENLDSLKISEAGEVVEFSNTEQVEKFDDEKLDVEAKKNKPEDPVNKTSDEAGSGETEQARQEQEHSATYVGIKKDAELVTEAVELKVGETTQEAEISETDCTSTVAEENKEYVETLDQPRSEFEPVIEEKTNEIVSLSDDIDVTSTVVLDENKSTEILTEAKEEVKESEEKPDDVMKEETCDTSSINEDKREVVTTDRSSDYTTEQNLEDSSTDLLEEHNHATTEASETADEPQEKVETSPVSTYVPPAADTIEGKLLQKQTVDNSYNTSMEMDTVTVEQVKDSELKENPEETKCEAAETDALKVTPAAETSEDLVENTLPNLFEKEIGEEILHEPETITTEVPEAATLDKFDRSDIKHAQDSGFDESKNVEILPPEISDERDASTGETLRDIVSEQDPKEPYATSVSEDAVLTTSVFEPGAEEKTNEVVSLSDDVDVVSTVVLDEKKNTEILTEAKEEVNESEKKPYDVIQEETCDTSSVIEDDKEVVTADRSFVYTTEQNLTDSSTDLLEEHNHVTTEASETVDEPQEKVETSPVSPYAPPAADTIEEKLLQKQIEPISPSDGAYLASLDTKTNSISDEFDEEAKTPVIDASNEASNTSMEIESVTTDKVSKEVEEAKESVEEELENKMESPDQPIGNLENADSIKTTETRDLQESENQSGEPELDMEKDEQKPVSITNSEMETSEEQIEENHESADLEPSAQVECRTELDDEDRIVQALQETKTEEDIQGGGTEMPFKVEPILEPEIQSRETEVSIENLRDDILTEEVSAATEKTEESEKVEEEITTEHQTKLESNEMITDQAPLPVDNLEATIPCESTETVKEVAAEGLELDQEQSANTHELDEDRKIVTKGLIIDNTKSVSAISEDTFEDESTKEPEGCIDETHIPPVKPVTEDTIPEEVQEVEKSTRDFDTTSDDKTHEVIATSTDLQEENTYEVEESKHSDAMSQSEEKNVEDILESHKVPIVDGNSDDVVESETNPQDIIASEVLLQETVPSVKIEEKDVSESYFSTSTEKEACITKEEPRELEGSDLKLESIEDRVDDSTHEAEKEESAYLGESISVAQQENVSEIKVVDLPSENDKSLDTAKTTDSRSKEVLEEDTLYSISSNREDLDLTDNSSAVKEISAVEVDDTCQVPYTPDFQTNEKVFESVFGEEAENPEETETTEQQNITVAEAEEHQSGIANESITNEIIEKEISKYSAVGSPDIETVGKDVQLAEEYSKVENIQELDSITNAIQNEELSEVLQTASLNENKQEQVLANKESLEEEEKSDATEAPNTGATTLNVEVKHEEGKESTINKEALYIPNVVEDAQAEEAAPKVLQKVEEICEDVPKEPVHEKLQAKDMNTDVEEKNIDISESLKDGEKPDIAIRELTFDAHDVTEDLNLKEQSISPNEEPSNIISEKLITTKEFILEEVKFNKYETESTKYKEKVEEFDDAKTQSISAYGDTKTQDQSNVSSPINDSSVEITKSNKVDLVSDKDVLVKSYPEVQQVPEKQIIQESEDIKSANASAIKPEEGTIAGKTQSEETKDLDRSLLIEQREAKEIATPVEEENEDEHERVDSGSDGPVMVEASTDVIEKAVPCKKSHNILSGVGSKVKHSIAKVRKVITGKSSHPKPSSPK